MKKYLVNIEKKFNSSINSIKLIEPVIFKVRESVPIPDSIIYNILISVTEAVNNAIIHGNKSDNSKIVDFSVSANKGELIVKVEDQGGGFIPENLADPRDPENLLKSNGRGVFIIKELTDFCNFEMGAKGTIVTMKFFLKDKHERV